MRTPEMCPIVLFVYNRPDHTLRTLEALRLNELADASVLYVYSDGPKPFASKDDVKRIIEVRKIVNSHRWCKKVYLSEEQWNRGLASSIVRGVTEVVGRHGRVIVLEDDIVTRRGFLRYMNEALETYKDCPQVMHISGMIYGTPSTPGPPTAFLRILSCNGWGTWRRAWVQYNDDALYLIRRIKELHISRKKFNIEGHAHFYVQLQRNCDGTLNTWAVKWYASWLIAGGYSLFPRRSLLTNIGHDGSGVHSVSPFYNGETVDAVRVSPIPIKEDMALRSEVDHIWKQGVGRGLKVPPVRIRKYVGALFTPIRPLVRRFFYFIFPELILLNRTSPHFALTPNSTWGSTVSTRAMVYPPYHIRDSYVGDYSYIARNAWISLTRIGKFCSIGPNLVSGWGVHPTNGISTSPIFYSTRRQNGFSLSSFDKVQELKPITIGNDVYIGMNVTVLDGVTIGDGAVVGAGCIVTKDVPPYAVVFGNPMRYHRYRFDQETIHKLLEIKWWDWPLEDLHKISDNFFNVNDFVQGRVMLNDRKPEFGLPPT